MKRKPYSEQFTGLEVVLHGCLFHIDGTVGFDLICDEEGCAFDFDVPNINLTAVAVPSGDDQTDKDFIKFFWAVGSPQIETAVGMWLKLYHGSKLENEDCSDRKYDEQTN